MKKFYIANGKEVITVEGYPVPGFFYATDFDNSNRIEAIMAAGKWCNGCIRPEQIDWATGHQRLGIPLPRMDDAN